MQNRFTDNYNINFMRLIKYKMGHRKVTCFMWQYDKKNEQIDYFYWLIQKLKQMLKEARNFMTQSLIWFFCGPIISSCKFKYWWQQMQGGQIFYAFGLHPRLGDFFSFNYIKTLFLKLIADLRVQGNNDFQNRNNFQNSLKSQFLKWRINMILAESRIFNQISQSNTEMRGIQDVKNL